MTGWFADGAYRDLPFGLTARAHAEEIAAAMHVGLVEEEVTWTDARRSGVPRL